MPKRKLDDPSSPANKKSKTDKPTLKSAWTRTDPVSGEQGRLRKKDADYRRNYNRRKKMIERKKEQRRLAKEKEEKNKAKEKKAERAKKKSEEIAGPISDDEDDDSKTDERGFLPFHRLTKRFTDHVCVVTGAGRGIGQSCALRLAQEGGVVYVLDQIRWKDTLDMIEYVQNEEGLNKNKPKKRRKNKPRHIKCNVTDEADVKRAIDQIIDERGYIDVLLNCVNTTGTDYGIKDSCQVTLKEFDNVIKRNLYATVIMCNQVIPHMLKEQYGRIVNLAAQDGKIGKEKCLAFSAAKAAVISATKSYGKEYAGTGLTINCIAPQYDQYHVGKGHDRLKLKQKASQVPMGRASDMEELAGVVAFIASEENSYTTGFCYDITGGTSTY